MALIANIKAQPLQSVAKHSTVECTYTVVITDDGKCLQLDTYGSAGRALPGKKSQSLRFSPEALQQLKQIIQENGL
ncbi:hypothetical protein E4O93_16870 [Diaphorobacter sp. DS2]|uniref:hypothetical protein n=1 Tax=Diaphorobacter sp. TaxID=1934310 RepID=UPI00107360D8|nr:hypothetical protein [Diaphorobacter sp.]TFI46653.1 hypothetical protein E4O93_16870 [Diaphorobacter sp. DS2]